MFLDEDQFQNSSGEESAKNNNKNKLLDLDDDDDEMNNNIQENLAQQNQEKLPYSNQTKTFSEKQQQQKIVNDKYNFLYEIDDQKDDANNKNLKESLKPENLFQKHQANLKDQQSKEDKTQKLKEQFDNIKKQQTRTQQGTLKANQFKPTTSEFQEDTSNLQKLLPQSALIQFEPGLPQQQIKSNLPKLKEQNAHIALNQEKIEAQKVSEKKEISLITQFQNKDISSSEEIDSDQEKQKEHNHIEDKEEDEKEQFNVRQTPVPSQQVQTTFEPMNTLTLLNEQNITDMREFLTKPCPKGYLIQTTIIRQKSGFGWFYPKYRIFLSVKQLKQFIISLQNGKKYLMSAKKKSLNKTSNYVMSLSQDNFKSQSEYALGKYMQQLRSNFLGTEFKIYDNGLNPTKSTQWDKVRAEIGAVLYESNMLGTKGPRKMQVLLPKVKENGERVKFKPLKKEEGIVQSYKAGKKEEIFTYSNKPPKWNEQVQAFVLNFYGRVDKPSVKNFQLIDEKEGYILYYFNVFEDDIIYMQFGRIANQQFNLDIQYPLSLVQGVGIALSSFDYKLACE